LPASEEIVRGIIVGSPFGTLLGLETESIETDRVRVRLPFRRELTTVGEVVHGGAVAGLVDIAATAAAWSAADVETSRRGTTVGFTVNLLAPGRAQDLIATAQVLRRGGTLCVCEVDVRAADGTAVARALVTYRIGSAAT
jgi:uncharacterized protein (TIGR00369 family)